MEKTKLLQLLKTLINIDSQSANKIGVKEVQGVIADELVEMGFEINWIKSSINQHDFLLHAQLKSNLPNSKVVSFICHADTALSLRSYFQKTENKILGTGSADNKGGVVVGLFGIREYLSTKKEIDFEINFLVSPNEEIGSIGFHDYLNSQGKVSHFVFGLEPALANGNLIKSRSGNRWYQVSTKGIQAHSGRINIPKLNSLHETLYHGLKILDWAKQQTNVRINLNSIQTSSDLYNTIPETSEYKLDLRFENNTNCEIAHDFIINTLQEKNLQCEITNQSAITEIHIADNCPAMEEKNNFFKTYELIGELLLKNTKNEQLKLDHSWGAADISHMSHPFNFTIDGLGPVGAGMHREDEFIFTESIFEKISLLKDILSSISHNLCFDQPWRDYEHNLPNDERSQLRLIKSSFANELPSL